MGLGVSDQAVRATVLNESAFQEHGAFSKARYERVLRLQGMTPSGYEDALRRQLLATQLPRAIRETAFVTPETTAESASLLAQQRALAYVRLPRADFTDAVEPPRPNEIRAYYDEHQAEFATPEQVKVSYLLLDPETAVEAGDAVDEASLRAAYRERLDEFTEPERRHLRHILLRVPNDADAPETQAVRERLQAVRARIEAGESFTEVAAEVSEDPGSADAGGDLGFVERGGLDPAFEQVAFALEPGTLSEPVRSRFGYHLVEVLEVEGGEAKPFAEVRDQLAAEMTSGSAEAAFFEQAEQLATLTYESPDSLIPAAEALGLEIQTSDWIERGGKGEGLFANPKVLAAAFSDEVLERGNNSELIEPDRERLQALVLRAAEHREPSVRPLDEVRDEIIATLEQRRAAAAALDAAERIVARAEAGEALADAAGGFEVVELGLIGRSADEVPPAVLELGFAMPRTGPGQTRYQTGTGASGDALVVALSEVVDGGEEAMDADRLRREERVLANTIADAEVQQVLRALQARADITRQSVTPDDGFR
jgi:peptidyl-prolyl cis-trans isomerase D